MAEMSMVLRVMFSKVLMPRSHSMTSRFPPAMMYSADSSHSWIVAERPRLSMTALRCFPSSFRRLKFCMLRAPTCRMSACSATNPTWLVSITSVTTRRPCRSATRRRWRRPSSQALEGVGGGARLEGPPAQDAGPVPLHGAGDDIELLLALDRAGARDHEDRKSVV